MRWQHVPSRSGVSQFQFSLLTANDLASLTKQRPTKNGLFPAFFKNTFQIHSKSVNDSKFCTSDQVTVFYILSFRRIRTMAEYNLTKLYFWTISLMYHFKYTFS